MSALGQNFLLYYVEDESLLEHRHQMFFWKTLLISGEYFLAIYVIDD